MAFKDYLIEEAEKQFNLTKPLDKDAKVREALKGLKPLSLRIDTLFNKLKATASKPAK